MFVIPSFINLIVIPSAVQVLPVSNDKKKGALIDILNELTGEKVLVFVEEKRQADFLASYLSLSGFPTTSIHGNREQPQREEALR